MKTHIKLPTGELIKIKTELPFKNLEEFRKSFLSYKVPTQRKEDPNFWPCLECKGEGSDYDPNDPPCPVEGNKGRARIACATCEKTGRGRRSDLIVLYKKEQARLKEKLRLSLLEGEKTQKVLNKLSKKDWETLQNFQRKTGKII